MSSAVNVLTSSTKIFHVYKRDLFQLNWLGSYQWIRWRWWMDFLDIYLTTFSESIISEIQKLWGSSFASKYLKCNLDFKNVARNWKKVFCFWGNCIWTGIVKLSLLRTGYFSFSANFLLGSTKIWHVNRREFFQLNWIGRGQWIW